MRLIAALAGLALAAFVQLAGGAAAPDSSTAAAGAATPSVPFTKYRLANGLEVILAPDKRLPIVAVNLWYHVGAANEEPGRTGFAHLFEHMMFTGSKHIARGEAERLLEAAGGADSNASTSFDRTNYYDTVPANQLELALWTHADRMGYLLDALDQKALSNQQDVVRNERRETTENRPYGIVDEAIYTALFPPGHPYRADVIGSHADIQAARLADVRDFFKRYYRPNNATLVIAGDFDPANARRLVQKYFGSFARGPDVPKPSVVTPPIDGERRLTVTDRVELPRLNLAWLTPPAFAPGDAELDIAGQILAGGKSSRLYKTLVYDKELAQGVDAGQASSALTSIFEIQALARPGHTPAELETAIDAELARLASDGPTQAEVDRARSAYEHDLFRGLERVGGGGGRANRLNYYNQYTGDPGYLAKDLERYRKVTPDDVKRAVAKYLAKDSRVVLYATPGEKKLAPDVPATPVPANGRETEAINRDEPWRKSPPRAGAAVGRRLPEPATFRLANGLTVYHLERSEVPVANARLVVNGGLSVNPGDTPGLVDFTVASLEDGTATRDALAIADAFAQLGADYGASTARDASVHSVDALAAQFPAALALLADVVQRPTFPADEIERARRSRQAAVIAAREDPASLADAAFRRSLYGTSLGYGQTTLGTEASLARIDGAMLREFWQRWYHPANAALVIVGAIDRATARTLAERELGGWSGAAAARPAPVATLPAKATSARLVLVERAGVNQIELRVGRVAAARASPDYFALQLANEILGGGFTSRLNANLREAKGFAYGAFSRFDFGRSPGPFAVATTVRDDATAPAVKEIDRELDRMRASAPSRVEFAKARDGVVRSLPGAFESNGGIAGAFGSLFVYGLPTTYFATLPSRFAAVPAAEVLAVSKRYLDPAQMVVVGVGDPAALKVASDALGLAPVERFTPAELY
ncbi:MAG: pitrilysin family protein [Casimicrobiaceae bacterium]